MCENSAQYHLLSCNLFKYIAESEEELKSLLMKVKEESEKDGLKRNIQNLRSWYPVPSLHGKKWRKSQCGDRVSFLF